MELIGGFNRISEEVKAEESVLLKILEVLHKNCIIHCRYLPNKDQFFVCCYVDRNDDDAYFTMNFDYEEALQLISDAI
ncbi:hypothetical protein [Clostridium sp.]|uniref:hypothetical protein n=1 Tax=Clostridium sp. TaxID=1506 RepID=UPI00321736CA